jgi:hypothetical protein
VPATDFYREAVRPTGRQPDEIAPVNQVYQVRT